MHASVGILQVGLPDIVPGLIAVAGTVVLVLMLVAMGGYLYKSMTGGVEWPEDREEDPDAVRRGEEDDEWEYY